MFLHIARTAICKPRQVPWLSILADFKSAGLCHIMEKSTSTHVQSLIYLGLSWTRVMENLQFQQITDRTVFMMVSISYYIPIAEECLLLGRWQALLAGGLTMTLALGHVAQLYTRHQYIVQSAQF